MGYSGAGRCGVSRTLWVWLPCGHVGEAWRAELGVTDVAACVVHAQG